MTLSPEMKALNTELQWLSQTGGVSLDAHGKARKMPRNPFESDCDYRDRMQRQIRDEMFDASQQVQERPSFYAEVRPDGHTGVSVAQATVDISASASATLSGHDLDHIAKRYGLDRKPDEKDCWFRVRIQRAASGIIQKARDGMHEQVPEIPTPSGREIFEREYMTKIEPKRYTLEQAFDILMDGIHPASFMAESGLTSSASVGAVRVMRSMMRRNIDKAGGK